MKIYVLVKSHTLATPKEKQKLGRNNNKIPERLTICAATLNHPRNSFTWKALILVSINERLKKKNQGIFDHGT